MHFHCELLLFGCNFSRALTLTHTQIHTFTVNAHVCTIYLYFMHKNWKICYRKCVLSCRRAEATCHRATPSHADALQIGVFAPSHIYWRAELCRNSTGRAQQRVQWIFRLLLLLLLLFYKRHLGIAGGSYRYIHVHMSLIFWVCLMDLCCTFASIFHYWLYAVAATTCFLL